MSASLTRDGRSRHSRAQREISVSGKTPIKEYRHPRISLVTVADALTGQLHDFFIRNCLLFARNHTDDAPDTLCVLKVRFARLNMHFFFHILPRRIILPHHTWPIQSWSMVDMYTFGQKFSDFFRTCQIFKLIFWDCYKNWAFRNMNCKQFIIF